MVECGYCGIELAEHDPHTAGRHREYCTDSHRVMASRLRTAEALYDKEAAMDPDPVALPELTIEAYGTVTPPPDPTPEQGEDDNP